MRPRNPFKALLSNMVLLGWIRPSGSDIIFAAAEFLLFETYYPKSIIRPCLTTKPFKGIYTKVGSPAKYENEYSTHCYVLPEHKFQSLPQSTKTHGRAQYGGMLDP